MTHRFVPFALVISFVVITSATARADVSAPLVCIALHGHTKVPLRPAFGPLSRQPTWTDTRPPPIGFRTFTLPIVRATF